MRNQNSNKDKQTAKKKRNIYQEITQQIIEKMHEGKLIWKQGFRQITAQNWISKNSYTGINGMILNFLYGEEICPFYATFRQITNLGGTVKKGCKGKMIVYFSPYYKKDGKYIAEPVYKKMSKQEKKQCEKFYALRHYFVFNLLDTENCKDFDYQKWGNVEEPEKLEDKELLLSYEEILSHYQDKPTFKADRNKNAYSHASDTIFYVPVKRWKDKVPFYISMLCHELIHSTGHEKRLNRPNLVKPTVFGTPDYAKEELTAELGAAFLCQHIGIFSMQIENKAAYLQSWIAALENDERLIFRAASEAQKAVDYIFNEKSPIKN